MLQNSHGALFKTLYRKCVNTITTHLYSLPLIERHVRNLGCPRVSTSLRRSVGGACVLLFTSIHVYYTKYTRYRNKIWIGGKQELMLYSVCTINRCIPCKCAWMLNMQSGSKHNIEIKLKCLNKSTDASSKELRYFVINVINSTCFCYDNNEWILKETLFS